MSARRVPIETEPLAMWDDGVTTTNTCELAYILFLEII
jgi:hypothetical protein